MVHQETIRAWPRSVGTTTAAVTTEPEAELETHAEAIVAAGYEGIFHAQFMDGRLLDLNLRPYGTIGLAAAAGLNLPALAADDGDAARGARGERAPAFGIDGWRATSDPRLDPSPEPGPARRRRVGAPPAAGDRARRRVLGPRPRAGAGAACGDGRRRRRVT